ncbi:MAG TPA: NYN domain-containing protein [bacterium]|nr:NYN domain-containing protein [bacterium]HPQ71991.1 NYN domain-containing protein [bacterium]
MSFPEPQRAAFFVDGFNLYHSLCSAAEVLGDVSVKWLDLGGLFTDHLDLVGAAARLSVIRYYTAYAEHLGKIAPGKVSRHRAYVRALTALGVKVELSNFKRKDAWDTYSGQQFVTHEEKETDVAIACAVIEGAARNEFDVAVVVSGDTDLRPLVCAFQRLYSGKRLIFAFPFDRKNRELVRIAPGSFTLSAESYARHQLPGRVRLPSGKHVYCPEEWVRETRTT